MPFNILGGDLTAVPVNKPDPCPPTLDFATDGDGLPLVAGQIIDDEFASLGILVTTGDPGSHPVMVYDSSCPGGCTGGDPDLGTPNSGFGGPGVGSGGAPGKAGRNGLPRGNLLIVSEDGDSSDPDDEADGGMIVFHFDDPVRVDEVHVVDIDEGCGGGGGDDLAAPVRAGAGCTPGTVKAFDAADALIVERPLLNLGDNSFQIVPLGVDGVSKLKVTFSGSAALSEVVFCRELRCG